MMTELRIEIEKERDAQIKRVEDHLTRISASFDCCMSDPDLGDHFGRKVDQFVINHQDAMKTVSVKDFPSDTTWNEYVKDLAMFRDLLLALIDTHIRGQDPRYIRSQLLSHLASQAEARIKSIHAAAAEATARGSHLMEEFGIKETSDVHNLQ